jgi:hypothetical protein
MYSKLQKSSLLSLCKQRKEIIKAAKYCRYDLASSFDIYLESLLKLGNSLNQYVEQEFVIFDHFDFDHLHFDDDGEEKEYKELRSVDFRSESKDESIRTRNHRGSDGNIMRNSGKPRVEFENTTKAQFNLYHDDDIQHNIHDHMHMSHQDFGHYGSKPFPMVVSPNHGTNHQHNVAATLSPPPAPPRPQAYNWDLLYPFNMNYEVPNYDHRDNYDIRDEDVRKIREREGIPDLEDESELNSNVSRLNVKRDSFPSNEDEIKCDLEPKITTPVSSSTMSIKEAVLDIKNDCKHIYDCGREFSLVIETGKIPYHSVSTKLRGKINLLFFFACELIDKSKNTIMIYFTSVQLFPLLFL